MIHNIAIKIVNSLSKYGSAQKKRDVNIYGTECFINETICNFLLYTHTFEKTRANYGFCRKRLFRHFFIDIYCSFLTAMLELQNRVHSVHNI